MKSRVVDQITNQPCSQGLSSIREEKMDTGNEDGNFKEGCYLFSLPSIKTGRRQGTSIERTWCST